MSEATPTPAAAPKPDLRWEVPIWVVINAFFASLPLLALDQPQLALYTILPSLLLTIILLLTPNRLTPRVGFVMSATLTAIATFSVVVAGNPVLAIASMVTIIYLSSLPQKPVLIGLGSFVGLAYLIYTWLGPPAYAAAGADVVTVVVLTVAACALTVTAMVLTFWVFSKLRPSQAAEIEESREEAGVGTEVPDQRPSFAERLGPANPMFRYALVRALAFGIVLAVTFSQRGDQSGFWVLLAMMIVGRPTGHAAWRSAFERIVATLIGVVVFLVAFMLLDERAMLAATALILLVGLAWLERSSLVVAAAATVFVIAIAGVGQSDYLVWAQSRLIDTIIGSVIGAVISMFGEARPDPGDPAARETSDA
jgi:hypothetical protein